MKKFFLSFVMLLASAVSALASLPTIEVELTVDENGATTFICPFDAELPTGVRAYTVTGWSDETGLILEETSIIANTPCILRSETPITETLTGVSLLEAATYTEGALTGVYAPVEITSGWVLAEIDGQWGLHEVNADEGFTVPENQGYFVFLEDSPSDLFEGYIPDPFNPEIPETTHTITYPESSLIGSWDVVLSAAAGDEVTATATITEGYHVESFIVNNGAVEVTQVSETVYTFTMPDEDVTIVAPFAINKYTVRFFEDETMETEYTELRHEVEWNSKATKPADPIKRGHNFLNWVLGGEDYDFDNFTVTENTDIYATWEEVPAAKWTDEEGNELTKLGNSSNPYYSYLTVYPIITLHLEGAVNQEDGDHEFPSTYGIIAEGTKYTVENGQVNQDVTFTLKPGDYNLFDDSVLPKLEYSYSQTELRNITELAPLWDETIWDWEEMFTDSAYDFQLDATTIPAAGSEYVLAKLGEMPIEEEGSFNASVLKVKSNKPCAKNDDEFFMEASKITFENRSAGKMTIVFSNTENREVPVYINVDGNKWGEEFNYLGNIEDRNTWEDYDKNLGSMSESDKKTITFYVNPGVHTISGHYSGNTDHLVALDESGELDEENPYMAYFYPSEGFWWSEPEDAIEIIDLDEYYAAQNIRVYSMHFEPIVHEVTVYSQYGWASLFHEHDLIVPEDANFEFFYAPSCDGINVELVAFVPQSQQMGYDGLVIPDSTALVFRDNNHNDEPYTFYGATVGKLEEGEWLAGDGLQQPKYDPFEANNLFQGVIEETPCASMQYHVMGNKTTYEAAIFQPYSGTMLGAHKVYLDLGGVNTPVRLVLPGNRPVATGIENTTDIQATKALVNGQFVIKHGARTINANGVMLK